MSILPAGDLTQAADPTKTAIDRGVTALFRAMIANAKGDRLMVAAARGELVTLAGEADDFEQQLTMAAVDRLAPILANASRAQIAQVVSIDVRRHVGTSLFLAQLQPWGHA